MREGVFRASRDVPDLFSKRVGNFLLSAPLQIRASFSQNPGGGGPYSKMCKKNSRVDPYNSLHISEEEGGGRPLENVKNWPAL